MKRTKAHQAAREAKSPVARPKNGPRHNVLVITLGGAPGVVTETAYALLSRSPRWVPHEIHLVTTTFGAKDWSNPDSRANRELRAVFRHFDVAPVDPRLLVPEISAGNPIADIRTEEQNVAFANALTWLIKEIKERSNTRLHVSMAGGRKTMSSYSQAAVSFFAEANDELTHSLVEPSSLEYSPDFFWPQQQEQDINVSKRPPPSPPNIVKASTAEVTLVPSPFVRLRQHMRHIPFARQNFDHWTLTERVQANLDAYSIEVRVEDGTLVVHEQQVKFGHQEFALYRVLAAAVAESWRGVGPEGQGDDHVGWVLIRDFLDPASRPHRRFFEFYRDCFSGHPDEAYWRFKNDIEVHLKLETAGGQDYVAGRFTTLRNKIKQKLETGIGSYSVRRRVMPETRAIKPKGRSYGVALEPHEIAIIPRPPANEPETTVVPTERTGRVRDDSTSRKRAVR
jgi:CRISPR-associated protein (TIGR02584 family)